MVNDAYLLFFEILLIISANFNFEIKIIKFPKIVKKLLKNFFS